MRPIEIDSVKIEKHEVGEGLAGDQVIVTLRGVEDTDIRPGMSIIYNKFFFYYYLGNVVCSRAHPWATTKVIPCNLMILECDNFIAPGYQCIYHSGAVQEEATIDVYLLICCNFFFFLRE
jgi:translation elongation factor EF-1alpha